MTIKEYIYQWIDRYRVDHGGQIQIDSRLIEVHLRRWINVRSQRQFTSGSIARVWRRVVSQGIPGVKISTTNTSNGNRLWLLNFSSKKSQTSNEEANS